MMKVALGVLSGLILSLPLLQAADDAGKENKSPKAKTVEIQATVHYVGNSYTRLPDGKIIGTKLRGKELENAVAAALGK